MLIDFISAFEPFGLKFTPSHKKKEDGESSWVGLAYNLKEKLVIKTIYAHGPAYQSNLSPGDEIIAVNNSRLTVENRDKLMKTLKIEHPAELLINRMGDVLKIKVIPKAQPFNKFELNKFENPTESQKSLYEYWLNCKWEDE